jgi:hypothetical protein
MPCRDGCDPDNPCDSTVPPSAAADGPPLQPGKEQVARTYPLATLSLHRALHLHGRQARFRVSLTNDGDPVGKFDYYECAGDDDSRLYTVMFPAGQEVEDAMVVEAVLVVIHHKGGVTPSGERFGECVEFRLLAPRQVKR